MKRLFAIMLLVCGLTYGQTPVINAPRIFQAPTGFTGNIVTLKVGGVTYFGVSSTKATFAVPILPSVAAGVDLGSSTLPFKDIYIAGTSGTPAANNFRITGASTDGMMTVYFPNADTQTVRANAGAAHEFFTSLAITGIFSRAQPAFTDISGIATTTQGGTGANLSGAGAGTYPKSNGATPAVYGASTLAASGVGTPTACTNQFVTGFTLAGDSAPTSTCTSIVAGDLGTTLTPQFARVGVGVAAHATDLVTITSADTTASSKALNIAHSGAIAGTGYGAYVSKTGASTTNVGGYFSAAGGTNNYGLLTVGNLGFGTILPVGALQTKFTATTPIVFATGDTLGSYTSVTFPTANKDYASKTGICTSCAVGDLVIITAGTGAYTGSYNVAAKISDNSIQLSRTCHNEGADIVDGAVSIVSAPKLTVGDAVRITGPTINTNVDGTIAALNIGGGSYTKNDANTRTFSHVRIVPTFNFGGSNTTTIVNVLEVSTVNTATTGATINLLSLKDGNFARASISSGGVFVLNNGPNSPAIDLTGGTGGYLIYGNGATSKTIGIARHTTADTAGSSFTHHAGGATIGATNKSGGNNIQQSGIGTGSAVSSQFIVQTPTPIGTGTADQTLANRLVADNTGVAFASGIVGLPVTLTDAAISVFDITLAAGARTGGTFSYSIDVWDGTDGQVLSGVCTWAAVNKGGVYTDTTTCDAANDAKAVSAGTLTATWALVDDTNKMIMKVTPAGSLTETTYQVYVSILNKTPAQITLY